MIFPNHANATNVTPLGALLAGKLRPVSRRVQLPYELGEAVLRLLSAAEEEAITLELAAWLRLICADSGISPDLLAATGHIPINVRCAHYTIARVVRDRHDESKPFATFEEWRRLDAHTVGEVFRLYQDLVEELDPVGRDLDDRERAEVAAAIAAKDPHLLSVCGLRKLAVYLASTPPAAPQHEDPDAPLVDEIAVERPDESDPDDVDLDVENLKQPEGVS